MSNLPLTKFILSSETLVNVPKDTLLRREKLYQLMENIPIEAFTRMQYFQPQINCLNRCAFCSQGAGTTLWQLEKETLKDIFIAIKVKLQNISNSEESTFKRILGYGRNEHRPGVIFPYLDNDISSYENLYEFIKYSYDELGVKVRISSTGFSRYNMQIQEMHNKICHDYAHAFDGIRFSITPYTYGWTEAGERTGETSREEFIKDLANLFRTYKPVINKIGIGKKTACVELRFKPNVYIDKNFKNYFYKNHHIIKSGPYLLVSKAKTSLPFKITEIIDFTGQWPIFNDNGQDYYSLISNQLLNLNSENIFNEIADTLIGENNEIETLLTNIAKTLSCTPKGLSLSIENLYVFENIDGIYFAINPVIKGDGLFSKHFYPPSKSRKSGYNDASRYFLNTLLKYKYSKGYLERNSRFHNATYEDIDKAVEELSLEAKRLEIYNEIAANHIKTNIIPLIETYAQALKEAELPPFYFFDREFTVDTGQIVNQGRAIFEFKGLISKIDTPLTPQEERGYGKKLSFSTRRGTVWRWSLSPKHGLINNRMGQKNHTSFENSIEITELDCTDLSVVNRDDRPVSYTINSEDLNFKSLSLKSGKNLYLIPGTSQHE